MSFICSANQLTGFYLIPIFTEKFFSKQAIKIWITLKKSALNMTKFASLEKNSQKNYHREKKSGFEQFVISLLFSKSMPWLLRVYTSPFFNFYITLLWYHQHEKLMKQLIFKTFASCSQIPFSVFLRHFGTPFSNGKNETKWQGTCSMLQWLSLVHCGSYLANVATRRWWKRSCTSR